MTQGRRRLHRGHGEHDGSLGQIRAAIDLDMFGAGGKLKLVELGLWPDCEPIPHTEWLMQWIERIADELGYDVGRMTATWGVAESGRLIEAGVPAAWFWKPDDFYYHSRPRRRGQARRQHAQGGCGHHGHSVVAAGERGRPAAGRLRQKGRSQMETHVDKERLIRLRQEGAVRVCEKLAAGTPASIRRPDSARAMWPSSRPRRSRARR